MRCLIIIKLFLEGFPRILYFLYFEIWCLLHLFKLVLYLFSLYSLKHPATYIYSQSKDDWAMKKFFFRFEALKQEYQNSNFSLKTVVKQTNQIIFWCRGMGKRLVDQVKLLLLNPSPNSREFCCIFLNIFLMNLTLNGRPEICYLLLYPSLIVIIDVFQINLRQFGRPRHQEIQTSKMIKV